MPVSCFGDCDSSGKQVCNPHRRAREKEEASLSDKTTVHTARVDRKYCMHEVSQGYMNKLDSLAVFRFLERLE